MLAIILKLQVSHHKTSVLSSQFNERSLFLNGNYLLLNIVIFNGIHIYLQRKAEDTDTRREVRPEASSLSPLSPSSDLGVIRIALLANYLHSP
jgi:hypothetical protein